LSSWDVAECLAARSGRAADDPSELAEAMAALIHLRAEGRAVRTAEGRWVLPR
jgi:hypothetical protein